MSAITYTPTVPVPVATTTYASFGRRLAASLIDDVIVVAALMPIILSAADSPLIDAIVFMLVLSHHGVLNGRGATVGKRLLGIAVIDEFRDAPGVAWGFVRSLLPVGLTYLSGMPGGTFLFWFVVGDGLSMLRHPKRQTWHDRMAGTYVVKV